MFGPEEPEACRVWREWKLSPGCFDRGMGTFRSVHTCVCIRTYIAADYLFSLGSYM